MTVLWKESFMMQCIKQKHKEMEIFVYAEDHKTLIFGENWGKCRSEENYTEEGIIRLIFWQGKYFTCKNYSEDKIHHTVQLPSVGQVAKQSSKPRHPQSS